MHARLQFREIGRPVGHPGALFVEPDAPPQRAEAVEARRSEEDQRERDHDQQCDDSRTHAGPSRRRRQRHGEGDELGYPAGSPQVDGPRQLFDIPSNLDSEGSRCANLGTDRRRPDQPCKPSADRQSRHVRRDPRVRRVSRTARVHARALAAGSLKPALPGASLHEGGATWGWSTARLPGRGRA
jgi:hypothetical protein